MSGRWLLRRVTRRLRRERAGFLWLSLAFAGMGALAGAAFTLSAQSARGAARLADEAHLVAYLDDQLPADRIQSLSSALARLPAVADVRQVDGARALQELSRQLRGLGASAGEPAADLEAGFLPSSLEVILRPAIDLDQRAADVASRLRRMPGVSTVDSLTEGLDCLAAFQALTRRLSLFLWVLAIAAGLATGSVLLGRQRIARQQESRALALIGAHPLAAWLPAALVWALAALGGGMIGLALGRTLTATLFDPTLPAPPMGAGTWLLALGALLLLGLLGGRLSIPPGKVEHGVS